MENRYMLTTFDNPFNPFVDFRKWYMFDCEKHYNTSSRVARLADINSEMTQKELDEAENVAMNFIIKHDLQGIYFKGTQEQIQKWIDSNNKSAKVFAKEQKTVLEATESAETTH